MQNNSARAKRVCEIDSGLVGSTSVTAAREIKRMSEIRRDDRLAQKLSEIRMGPYVQNLDYKIKLF